MDKMVLLFYSNFREFVEKSKSNWPFDENGVDYLMGWVLGSSEVGYYEICGFLMVFSMIID